MKAAIEALHQNPKYKRIIDWGKLITVTGSAQILIQVIGLGSGILIIRLMPTHEYAYYTLVNTMLGTMMILCDGGIAAAVMAQGGKVWREKDKLGTVIVSGIDLRKKFAIGSLLVAIPILFYLLVYHGASWLKAMFIVLALIPAFTAALSDTLLEVALKLKQDVLPLQRNQVSVAIIRLILLIGSVFIFPYAYIVTLANGIPRSWGNFKLRKILIKHADLSQQPDKAIKKDILVIVKRTLPGAIYYCISGQVTIWLISIFGSTQSLAKVGALSRLTAVLTLLNVLQSTLFEPRFARLKNERKIIIIRFLQIQGIVIFIGMLIMAMVMLFPDQITAILGKDFKGLRTEVLLITGASYVSFISGSVYKLSASRGIVPPPAIFFTLIIICQILFFFLVDYTQVKGALFFALYTSLFSWSFRTIYFFVWIQKNYKLGKLQ